MKMKKIFSKCMFVFWPHPFVYVPCKKLRNLFICRFTVIYGGV